MKKFFALCSLLLSTYVVADHHEGHFHAKGHGQWVKASGEHGKYNLVVHGHHGEHAVRLKQTFSHGEDSWTMIYVLKKKDHGFFDVMKAGKKIGEGYCFKGDKHKTCHHAYNYKNHHVEVTTHMMNGHVHRIGSVKSGQKNVKFRDHLVKVEKEHRK